MANLSPSKKTWLCELAVVIESTINKTIFFVMLSRNQNNVIVLQPSSESNKKRSKFNDATRR